jgi:Cytochrome c554 and c-prime
MPASSARRTPLLLVGVVSLGAVAVGLGGTGRGAPPIGADRAGGNPDLGNANAFRFVAQCRLCHNPGNTEKIEPLLIKYEENQDWHNRDKHSYAYEALASPRGQEMGRLLQTDVTREAACLNCHAPGYRVQDDQQQAKEEGVNCYACHGSFDNDKWFAAHTNPRDKWRDKTAEDKEKNYGLLAVRDPVRRAEVCASCHVGSVKEKRVLTHDMYAAGHPPLPSFEVAAYSLAEPPHWYHPREVPAFEDADRKLLDNFLADLSGLHHTKMALVGGAVALREAMDVMAQQAKAGGEAWPELAHFECFACHHDLQAPGYLNWRQVRGYGHPLDGRVQPGQAGRPHFRPWPTALVRLAIHHVGGGREMEGEFLDALRDL